LAAIAGLPFAFASHFAPDMLMEALALLPEAAFKPSKQLAQPYVMVGCNVVAADTDAEARRLFTSVQQAFTRILRDAAANYRPRSTIIESFWTRRKKPKPRACCDMPWSGPRRRARGSGQVSSPRPAPMK